MTRRGLGVMAMMAALLWAPSIAVGAPINELTDANASPALGTTTTLFRLSVRYVSRSDVPAEVVHVQVAGLDLPLLLVSGTVLDGVWAVGTLLPAGTWTPTYRAEVGHGPAPSLTGSPIVVSVAAASLTPWAPTGSPQMAPGEDVGGEPGPSASVAAAPAAGQGAIPSTAPRLAASAPVARATAPPTAPGKMVATPRPSNGNRQGRGRQSSPLAAAPSGQVLPAGTAPNDDGDLLVILGISIAAASVTLLGIGWMLTERRDDDSPVPIPATGPRPRSADLDAANGPAAVAARRARRRSTGHDPVLAAMGLEDDDGGEAPADPAAGSAREGRPMPRRGRPG